MKTIQIIRIEHPSDGNGIFCTKDDIYDVLELKDVCKRHFLWTAGDNFFPKPMDDTPPLDITKNKRKWFCAFKTIEQLNTLFYKKELQIILEHGFNILLLSVTEYQEGQYQVLYTKKSIVSKEIINSLFL